jgi:hypothetical protein
MCLHRASKQNSCVVHPLVRQILTPWSAARVSVHASPVARRVALRLYETGPCHLPLYVDWACSEPRSVARQELQRASCGTRSSSAEFILHERRAAKALYPRTVTPETPMETEVPLVLALRRLKLSAVFVEEGLVEEGRARLGPRRRRPSRYTPAPAGPPVGGCL